MVKENSEKKWLVLLVILVAIVLVVELLSLNVLYGLANSSALGGELATTYASSSSSGSNDPCFACDKKHDACDRDCKTGCQKSSDPDCLPKCQAVCDSAHNNCDAAACYTASSPICSSC